MKSKKYHTEGTVLKFNRNIAETQKNRYRYTHDRSPFGLGTGTSIKSGGVKLVVWTVIQSYNGN
jgi:hypothetical protein